MEDNKHWTHEQFEIIAYYIKSRPKSKAAAFDVIFNNVKISHAAQIHDVSRTSVFKTVNAYKAAHAKLTKAWICHPDLLAHLTTLIEYAKERANITGKTHMLNMIIDIEHFIKKED